MNVLMSVTLLVFIGHIAFLDVAAKVDVSYNDLIMLKKSCHPRDTCSETRVSNVRYSCSCRRRCSKLGTCCIDAPHKNDPSSELIYSCKAIEGLNQWLTGGVFMVDKCAAGVETSSIWKSPCESEWNGEDSVLYLAPVTSLLTLTTYKNYFCLRCYETTDNFLFWDIVLRGDSKNIENNRDFSVTFDKDRHTWLAKPERGAPIPVDPGFAIPISIASKAEYCNPDVISKCSDSWTDDVTREKCDAYTAIVYVSNIFGKKTYKNPHCGICNHESLNEIVCVVYGYGAPDTRKKIFPISRLLEISRQKSKCEENYVWDPYGKNCMKLVCALPGYSLINGRCTRL